MKYLDAGKQLLQRYVDEGKLPGAAFALVTPDGAELGCVGYRSLVPEKTPVRQDTVYDLASLTKVIATTTMALKLIEEGCFSLNTPVCELLEDFPHRDVTVRHLMTHTSGICGDDKAYRECRGEQQMWAFFRDKPLEFKPGTDLVYSDFGYIALGLVIEKFAGRLDAFARKLIFDPLQMNDTCYRPSDTMPADRCAPTEATAERGVICAEVHDGKAWRLDGISGNAGLFSTAADLSRFVRMLLCGGELDGKRVLSASTIALLNRCYTEGLPARRTLGWICNDPTASMGDYYSEHCLYHTGFSGTSVYVDFDRRCGVVLLTNRVHPSRENDSIIGLRNRFHNLALLAFDGAQ